MSVLDDKTQKDYDLFKRNLQVQGKRTGRVIVANASTASAQSTALYPPVPSGVAPVFGTTTVHNVQVVLQTGAALGASPAGLQTGAAPGANQAVLQTGAASGANQPLPPIGGTSGAIQSSQDKPKMYQRVKSWIWALFSCIRAHFWTMLKLKVLFGILVLIFFFLDYVMMLGYRQYLLGSEPQPVMPEFPKEVVSDATLFFGSQMRLQLWQALSYEVSDATAAVAGALI